MKASIINQVRRDMIAALQKDPKKMLREMTDHPQATLNQFTRNYGIHLLADDELPIITYLSIRLQQGHRLEDLLADKTCLKQYGNHSRLFAHETSHLRASEMQISRLRK